MLRRKPVSNNILMLAFVLLLGVISMAIGFFNHNSLMINMGLPVTLITSLLISIQNAVNHNKNNSKIN